MKASRAALLAPGVLFLSFCAVAPLLVIFIYSFASRGAYGGVVWDLGWHNYLRLADPLYVAIFGRSAYLALLTTLICLAVGYPLAYGIASARQPWRDRLLMLVVIPFWTNFLIRTYAWIIILREQGLLNGLLVGAGLVSEPLALLYTPGAVLVGFVYTWLPFMVLPLYASLEKLDRSLVEAAQDLGASSFHIFWRVVWPMTLPGVAAGSILVFIPALSMFAIPDLMGGARTLLLGNLIKNQFLSARNWPFGSAISVVLLAAMLGLLLAYARSLQFGRDGERR